MGPIKINPGVLLLCGLLVGASPLGWADQKATAEDGTTVLLKDDGTWEKLEQSLGEDTAKLTVQKYESLAKGCKLGVILWNEMRHPIRSLVLRFVAHKSGQIPYTSVSRGFSSLKPTDYQYREVVFHGLTCEQVAFIKVEGTRGCRMDDLEKHSSTAENCLGHVDVVPSELVSIVK